jgi:hypothetical protein
MIGLLRCLRQVYHRNDETPKPDNVGNRAVLSALPHQPASWHIASMLWRSGMPMWSIIAVASRAPAI